MTHTFYKYQGTGNDFILIDNRQDLINKKDTNFIQSLCDRRFGIGADGLILLEDHETLDFKMVYFNSDGNESTMCGNGGRCLTSFAKSLGLINESTEFEAIDGVHFASLNNGLVKLQMQNVDKVLKFEDHLFLDTGSPHVVKLVDDIDDINIQKLGSEIRNSQYYAKDGVNVNFVKKLDESTFSVRTYERGVEGETLSCGTGVTATAIAMHYIGETEKNHINIKTKGGELMVSFEKEKNTYSNVFLIGPAKFVFKGSIEW